MRYSFYAIVPLLFVGCVQPDFLYNDESITIQNQDQLYKVKLETPIKKDRFHNCLYNSYTIDSQNIHLERIHLKERCEWRGLAEGLYKDFLHKLISSLKLISTIKIKDMDIYKYAVDDKVFYMVTLYDASSDTFILDYRGELVSLITKENYIINKEFQVKERFIKSIIDNDIYQGYFQNKRQEENIIIFP